MDQDENFNPLSSHRPTSDANQFSIDDAEKQLLADLENSPEEKIQAMWALAQFYKNVGMTEMAEQRLRQLLDTVTELEAKAQIVLALGHMAEQAGDYGLAISFYREALSMEPAHSWTWYFIHNNLGYSLNQLRRYDEGETYCRRAIATDPKFPNAHKNLGLALQGQYRLREAAICFVDATRADAADSRSAGHLEELLNDQPELLEEFGPQLEFCRKSVEEAFAESRRDWQARRRKI